MARLCRYFCSGKAVSSTYSECLFVALGTQHALRMRHIVICDLPGCTMFQHFLINGKIFEKKLLNIKACFDFLYKFVWNISHPRNWAKYDQKYIYIRFHVNCSLFLSHLKLAFYGKILGKIPKYQISWKSIQRKPNPSMRADRHEEINSRFSQLWGRS